MKINWHSEYDFVVVGSGASGATAAVGIAEAGHSLLVLEAGGWFTKNDFGEDVYSSMKNLFRDFGAQVATGTAVMPVLEGCCVGGSTVMNGAIVHRLPEKVYDEWIASDPPLKRALAFTNLEDAADDIEKELSVKRNIDGLLPQLPISRILREKGWEHQAMLRNAPGCESSGRCLQGCPTGGKWSMEKTFIPRAMASGAVVKARTRVQRLLVQSGRVVGVEGRTQNGIQNFRARKGVLLAAGVMHTPRLLWQSHLGKRASPVGKFFQSHLGVGVVAKLTRRASEMEGPPQGIEITAFNPDKIKLATQLVPPELLLARTPLAGAELLGELQEAAYYSSWTASIRSEAYGELGHTLWAKHKLTFEPSPLDLRRTRTAIRHLCELMFAMGATRVFPGINGPDHFPLELNTADDLTKIDRLPLDARHYLMSLGHLFGTCRLGSDPAGSAVDPNFKFREVEGLYVIDASIFPSNLGVNPQHGIMTLARVATGRILEQTA